MLFSQWTPCLSGEIPGDYDRTIFLCDFAALREIFTQNQAQNPYPKFTLFYKFLAPMTPSIIAIISCAFWASFPSVESHLSEAT